MSTCSKRSRGWRGRALAIGWKFCLPHRFVVEGKVHGSTNIPSMTIAITFQMFELTRKSNEFGTPYEDIKALRVASTKEGSRLRTIKPSIPIH